jgi:hypothetical protein
MKYYAAVTFFVAVAAWLSCVSIVKTQASISRTLESAEVSPPSNLPPDYSKVKTVSQGRVVKPDNRLVKADNRAPLVAPKALRECRNIVDTLAYLNESTLQTINEAADRLH